MTVGDVAHRGIPQRNGRGYGPPVEFTPPAESSDVQGVAFSEEGSRVAVIYSDGRIIVHAIALDDVIDIARARVTRGLTDDECRTYLHVATCDG
jgi:hypothetical protein